MSTGKIIKSTGSRYLVKSNAGIFSCVLKGKIRLDGRKTTNPVAVGDKVDFEIENEENAAIINVHPRKNYIIRKSINLSKQSQILASNLDQVAIVATIIKPRTSLGFLDRVLITAEAYSIPAKIIFNKIDLLNKEENNFLQEVITLYSGIGYECFLASCEGENNSEDTKKNLLPLLKNKTTLLLGHSGAGKSSIINVLQPSLNLKTGEISSAHNKGMHTTTFAELHTLDSDAEIIDTPGIKELGLVEMKREEVGHYFPEILRQVNDCKFNNCLHINEPGCAVLQALEKNEISAERYQSYCGILSGEEMDWKKWEV